MNLHDFFQAVDGIKAELGDVSSGKSGRHSVALSVSVEHDALDEIEWEIASVEPDHALGCGCWDGLRITIAPRKNAST